MTITAEILADSVNRVGDRITTMRLRYPLFIHAEFMTHRVFSRNARSGRAVPVDRMIQEVLDDPAMPVRFGKHKPGMQDDGEHDEPIDPWGNTPQKEWIDASAEAVDRARAFHAAGYAKQVCNRLLHPFLHIDTIVTATEWENFFALRCHPDADPTMCALANIMREARDCSEPRRLNDWDQHMPMSDDLVQSVARCARVSYGRSEGTSKEADKNLFDTLRKSGHWSPFEHQAKAMPGVTSRNFKGWVQMRSALDGDD